MSKTIKIVCKECKNEIKFRRYKNNVVHVEQCQNCKQWDHEKSFDEGYEQCRFDEATMIDLG